MNRTFISLLASAYLMMVGVGMIVALLPQKIITYTGSAEKVGFLAASFAVSYILFQIPLGRMADRIGCKPILTAGYYFCCFTGVVFYFSDSAMLLFFGRFLQGMGEVPVWALASALMSILYPRIKGRAIGIYNAAIHMGLTTGPILGIFIQNHFPANQPFLIYSLLCLIGGFIVQNGTENKRSDQQVEKISIDRASLIRVLSQKMSLVTLTGITLYGSGYGIFITVLPAFLIKTKAFTQQDIGIFFAVFYISISVSQLICGPLSDTFGRVLFMIAGLTVAAAGFLCFQPLDVYQAICLLGIASFGLGTFFVASLAFLNGTVENHLKGSVSGAYFLFWGTGYFSGPLLIGLIEKKIHQGFGYYVISCLMLCTAVILIWIRRQDRLKRKSITKKLRIG